jgi:hypothetical protein
MPKAELDRHFLTSLALCHDGGFDNLAAEDARDLEVRSTDHHPGDTFLKKPDIVPM